MKQSMPRLPLMCVLYALLCIPAQATDLPVKITPEIDRIEVDHAGARLQIQRKQDPIAQITPDFQRTSRRCPPFCIQPMHLPNGVATIGELEMLGYLKRMADGDASILVVDSRDPDWVARGTIPGAVHVPWRSINTDVGGAFAVEAEADTLDEDLDRFARGEPFADDRTLVLARRR